MEKEPIENVQGKKEEEEIIKPVFRKEIIIKLQNIAGEMFSGKINLVFLTDVSSTPFGWSLKEYFKLKNKNNFLEKRDVPMFLRIDVSPIKAESSFLIKYFSDENLKKRENMLNERVNLLKKKYSDIPWLNPEEKLLKKIEFAEKLLDEVEKKLGKFMFLLNQKEKYKIMIFDETLPNEINKYDKELEKYKAPLIDDISFQSKTIPLVIFFILSALRKLKADAEIFAGGVDIWDVPWTHGFNDFSGEGRLNLSKADLKEGKHALNTPILPIARYEEFETGSGKKIVSDSFEKAKIVPLEYLDIPKKIINEMKGIGKEIYLSEKN